MTELSDRLDDDSRPKPSPKDRFITIYGRMAVTEVLKDPTRQIDKLIIASTAEGASLERILELADARAVPVQLATPNRVKLLAGNGRHDQGVVADVIAPRMRTLASFIDRLDESRPQAVLVLDGINNPSNVGMIIRTATAANMNGVVLPRVGSPDIDPIVIKASAGVAFRAAIIRCRTGAEAVGDLRNSGFRIYGLSGGGRQSLFHTEFADRSAFVLGNETTGIGRDTAEHVDEWLSIPMNGGVESLNVASAAAVLCFEVLRRTQDATGRHKPGRSDRHGGSGFPRSGSRASRR